MSELTWITLPGGISPQGTRQICVLVLPRLDAGRTLAEHGLLEWPPEGLREMPLEALFANETEVTRRVPLGAARWTPEPDVWSRVFPSDIPVRGGARQRSRSANVNVRALSKGAVAVESTFAVVAAVEVSAQSDEHEALAIAVDHELGTRWSGADDSPLAELPPNSPDVPEPERAPDFNRKLALMREHPAMLKALGLLLKIDIAAEVPAQGRIKVRPAAAVPPGLPPSVSPWTRYGAAFRPASSSGLIDAGVLRLDTPRWQLVGFDVDSAKQRLRDAARSRAVAVKQRQS